MNDRELGWTALAGGSWLFTGKTFADERGSGDEIYDVDRWPAPLEPFVAAQENVVTTLRAGCARGLHYQIAPCAQAKVVTILRGSAQIFWLPIDDDRPLPQVHSVVLTATAASLYTPGNCAHGMLALTDDTVFLLKMSMPVSLEHRGEVNLLSESLRIDFAHPLRAELLSSRDREAPEWTLRRRSYPAQT